jgi:glycosyl transferase family 87
LKRPPFFVVLVVAVAASMSTWFYANYILRAQQIADAAAHQRPRGNLSDLYPRWLGARELLKHGRNPYSPEITREIQQGYYGRPLDPSRADDPHSNEPRSDEPKDQQAFAYPAYVVFLLAPTVDFPFDKVQIAFRWLLIGLAVTTIFLWLRVMRWNLSCWWALVLALLMVGWLPMVQGIKLQQLSLLVAGFLAACAACLSGGWLFLAGGLLALATIKPQLAWPVVLWLLIWTISDWRSRWRLAFGFGLVMLLLLGGAELVLPGWLRMFFAAIQQYHRYTQNQSVLAVLFGSILGRILEVLCFLLCAFSLRAARRKPATSAAFGRSVGLVLALTVVLVPMFAPYNQVLLAPSILLLLRSQISGQPILPAIRVARAVGAVLLLWPWIATLALCAAYLWLTPELRQRVYMLPFYSNFMLPVFVFGLALLDTWMNSDPSMPNPSQANASI